jgi:uncharacterized protein YndB with AHSA1/START domain
MSMTSASETIIQEITIKVPAKRIFEALTDWQQDATETLVRFDLEEKDAVTTVRITHSGLTSEGAQAHKGWPQILGWLRTYVED